MKLRNPQLPLRNCPHCNITSPLFQRIFAPKVTSDFEGKNKKCWAAIKCETCGNLVLATSPENENVNITDSWPKPIHVDNVIPERAKEYLEQAISSLHAPAGAVMLTASSVDAMLKEKGYTEGVLFSRIKQAAADHLITDDMADWAHEIRLDANDQRHADDESPLPSQSDAEKVIKFAHALAEFLFVLPAKVERGRK